MCAEFDGLNISTNSSVGPPGPLARNRLISNGLVLLNDASTVHWIATLKLQLAVFMLVSLDVQVTVVVPTGKAVPEAGLQATVTPGQLSEVTGGAKLTTVPGSLGSPITVIFVGQVIAGGWVSLTLTLKVQLGPADVVQVTVVTPTGKNEPEAGEQVMVPQLPEVVGAG